MVILWHHCEEHFKHLYFKHVKSMKPWFTVVLQHILCAPLHVLPNNAPSWSCLCLSSLTEQVVECQYLMIFNRHIDIII